MAVLHITEADLARDLHAMLEKVRCGTEIVVEEEAGPVAVIRAPQLAGRSVTECIDLAKDRGSRGTMDDGFARDVEEAIRGHQEPWNPPSWD